MPERTVRLKSLGINRVAFVPAGDNPEAHLLLWKADPETTWTDLVCKRAFTKQRRIELAKAGAAIPVRNGDGEIVDGRYPIENKDDLTNAMQAIGRVAEGDRADVIKHIRKRARALDATDQLTDTFKEADVSDTEKAKQVGGSRLRRLFGLRDELTDVLADVTIDDPKEVEVSDAAKELLDKLPEEHREAVGEYIEGLEKKAAEASTPTPTPTPAPSPTPSPNPAPTPGSPSVDDEVAKALADQPEELRKAFTELTDRVAKAEAEAAAVREADELRKATEDAAGLGITPEHLIAMRKHLPADVAAEVERELHSKAEANAYLTREVGKDAEASEAESRLQALAKERAKADGTTEAIAMTKVIETDEGKALHREAVKEANER